MSPRKRFWGTALAVGALAGLWALPGAGRAATSASASGPPGSARAGSARAQAAPDQVIDAKTDPAKAGQTLTDLCGNIQNCKWVNVPTDQVTYGYGPARVLGDALYNCSSLAYAQTSVGVSEERSESTSISETASLKVSLSFLGLAKTSTEFEAFSKQSESFSTQVTSTNAVAVPPLWKGWMQTRVFSALDFGNAYVTDGIHLIEVSDIPLTFPGFMPPNDNKDAPVEYDGIRTPMTQSDIATRCGAVSNTSGGKGATGPVTPTQFKLTLCRGQRQAPRPRVTGRGRRAIVRRSCARQRVTGTAPPPARQASARLTRGGLTYATGTAGRAGIRLTARRQIRAGKYTLTITERHVSTVVQIGIR